MVVTIRQKEIINKLNFILDNIEFKDLDSYFDLISILKFIEDENNTSIETDDYIALINKLNGFIKEKDRAEKYVFTKNMTEVLEEYGFEARMCTSCLELMIEGYVIEGGMDYYCSDKCLEFDMTLEEFDMAYGDGETECYWTEWY